MAELQDILTKLELQDKLNDELKQNTKILIAFKDWRKRKNVFIVTRDDRVLSFGSNSFGVLGFETADPVDEPREVTQLEGKRVVEFFIAYGSIFARSEANVIYSWGTNGYGQLGRGDWSAWNIRYPPEVVKVINDEDKTVKQLALGYSHGLALTEKGQVYGWGNNLAGQCGCGKEVSDYHVDGPTEVKIPEGVSVTKIFAYYLMSYAITAEGRVYSWGDNGLSALGYESEKYVWEPRLIEHLASVQVVDVCADLHYAYYLDSDGLIHYCGQVKEDEFEVYQVLPRALDSPVKFTRLATDVWNNSRTVALSEGSVVYELTADRFNKTDHKSIEDYFFNEFGIIQKIFE